MSGLADGAFFASLRAPIILVSLEPEPVVVAASAGAAALYGRPPEALAGSPLAVLEGSAEAGKSLAARLAEAARAEVDVPAPFVASQRCGDQGTFSVEVAARRATVDGRPLWVCELEDVGSGRAAGRAARPRTDGHEAAVAEPEGTLAAIIDSTIDPIWVVDPETFALRFFNRALSEYLQRTYGFEPTVGLMVHLRIGSERDGEYWVHLYRRALAEGRVSVEHVSLGSEPRRFVLDLSAVAHGGRVHGIAAFAHDVTELRAARVRLQSREELLTHAVDTVGLALYEIAEDGELTMIGAAAVLGHTAADGPVRDFWRARIHPDDRERVGVVQRAIRVDGEPVDIEYRYLHPTRGTIWLRHEVRAADRRPDGGPLRIVGLLRDVTDVRAASLERERLESELWQAQKLEAIGVLAGGVAHDFNNMLGVIQGSAELALEELPEEHAAHEEVVEILRAAERSAAITGQLLAFARKQAIAPRHVELGLVTSDALKMVQRLVGEDIEVSLHLPPRPTWVHVDPAQIAQVLANLASNARDAIADVGRIVITVREVEVDDVFCEAHPTAAPGLYAALALSDDGAGMSAQTLERIWEPFFTTKELGRGTGLGLPTVLGIASQNGGFVTVASAPGHGTCFELFLPLLDAAKAERLDAVDARADLPRGGGAAILVVEDEPALLSIARKTLTALGYTVLAAGSPYEALGLSETMAGPLDLVLTDVIMPTMNGVELARRITARHPAARVVFSSGYPAEVLAGRRLVDLDAELLHKPFTRRELAERIGAALAGASS